MIVFLIVAEVPLGIIALEIVLGKGRCGVACGVKAILCISAFDTRDGLRHDAEGAIGELFDAPELFVSSCIGRNGGHLLIGCSGEGALSAFDGDLEVRIAEIATCLVDGGNGPALVRTEHISCLMRTKSTASSRA